MNKSLPLKIEKLNKDEIAFLKKKAYKMSSVQISIFKVLMISAVLMSFLGAWENVKKTTNSEPETVFSWHNYFIVLSLMIAIFLIIIIVLHNTELRLLYKDIRKKNKVVEPVTILRKAYIPHTHLFHLYISSPSKISIQVDMHDFNILEEGDEINIEYAQYSKEYFGYF